MSHLSPVCLYAFVHTNSRRLTENNKVQQFLGCEGRGGDLETPILEAQNWKPGPKW